MAQWLVGPAPRLRNKLEAVLDDAYAVVEAEKKKGLEWWKTEWVWDTGALYCPASPETREADASLVEVVLGKRRKARRLGVKKELDA